MNAATPAPGQGVRAFLARAFLSSLGAKLLMAVTGLLFFVWLCLHLVGNLAVFSGRDNYNSYAHFLQGKPALLWGQRVFLLVVAGLHVWGGIRLWWLNKQARPQGYRARAWRQASLSSRTMIVTGVIVLAFLAFHLAHFTILPGSFYPGMADKPVDPLAIPDVFGMVIHGFQNAPIAVFYAVAVGLVAYHLTHALWSSVQTLGLNGRRWTPFAQDLSPVVAALVGVGFALIPLTILFGGLQ